MSVKKKLTAKQKAVLALSSVLALGKIGIDLTLAYLTDSEQHRNVFTYGDVKVDLLETNWDETAAEEIVPLQIVSKNPKVVNTGSNDAVVFLKITVPVENYSPIDSSTGQKQPATPGEIFYMQMNSASAGTNANVWNTSTNGWVELPAVETGTDHTQSTRTYVFGYATALDGDGAGDTEELFQKVKAVNMSEADLPTEHKDILVEAYAIQAGGVLYLNGTDYIDTTGTISASDLTEIYRIFVGQNPTSHGKEADISNKLNLKGNVR